MKQNMEGVRFELSEDVFDVECFKVWDVGVFIVVGVVAASS